MTDSVSIELWIGATWSINGVATDSTGAPLDLTGGEIQIRIFSPVHQIIELKSPEDVLIQLGDQGLYYATLDDDDARQASIPAGTYRYEVMSKCVSGNGFAWTVQDVGRCVIRKSARATFSDLVYTPPTTGGGSSSVSSVDFSLPANSGLVAALGA